MKPTIHVLQFHQLPIFQQLQLEEALLRIDERNWCIINVGTPPAIVMGISGKPELLINRDLLQQQPIPVIRRFSGGGTVVVDADTLFTTFICNRETLQVDCCPEKIHCWAEQFYQNVFPSGFRLMENDYVLGDRKFGGNAQYLRKERWLHHSSLLWDFKSDTMKYLLKPSKMPTYRQGRDHCEFLCRLRDHHPNVMELQKHILRELTRRFHLTEMTLKDVEFLLNEPHRQATEVI